MLSQAAEAGTRRMFLLGLFLANQLFDAPLLPVVRDSLSADSGLKSAAKREIERLFEERRSISEEDIKRLLYRLRISDDLQGRLRYLQQVLTPHNTTERRFNLPRPFTFLYYVIRPVQFTIKYIWDRFLSRFRV